MSEICFASFMFIVITLSWNAITCFSGVELSMRSFFVILKTVLVIVKIEIEENGFWSKIENTRTIKILKSMNQNV